MGDSANSPYNYLMKTINPLIAPEAVADVSLSHQEVKRYSRHLVMPEVGMTGQKRLKAASILLIGAGGLGSPVAMYLAAAGIGRIGLVDYDLVDYSNLQRQIIHSTADVGRSKIASAKETMLSINPHIQIDSYNTPLTSANALNIIAPYDLVIDGSDNFPTRYLTNDACVLLGKPNIYGSIFRFEGQLSVFYAEEGPCYRCLFPEPPPPGLVTNCAEGGVLGILPGTVGAMQATEAVKLILGIGESMIGRLMLYDALNMETTEVQLRKNPSCPVCGERPTITELIDYEQFCGTPAHDHSVYGDTVKKDIPQMTAIQLRDLLDSNTSPLILDVRDRHEWNISNLGKWGALLIPQSEVMERVDELDRERDIIVQCRTGVRSADIVIELQKAGFTNVWNLAGGINQWAEDVDPSVPTY